MLKSLFYLWKLVLLKYEIIFWLIKIKFYLVIDFLRNKELMIQWKDKNLESLKKKIYRGFEKDHLKKI